MTLSTSAIDMRDGRPAVGLGVRLERLDGATWEQLVQTATDADGRCHELRGVRVKGLYRLRYATEEYFRQHEAACLFPYVEVVVRMMQDAPYQVQLLLSPQGYTVYRGK